MFIRDTPYNAYKNSKNIDNELGYYPLLSTKFLKNYLKGISSKADGFIAGVLDILGVYIINGQHKH